MSTEPAAAHTDIFAECIIHQRPPYRDCAGEMIAYASTTKSRDFEELRDEVDKLGYAVADKLGATQRGWQRKPK